MIQAHADVCQLLASKFPQVFLTFLDLPSMKHHTTTRQEEHSVNIQNWTEKEVSDTLRSEEKYFNVRG